MPRSKPEDAAAAPPHSIEEELEGEQIIDLPAREALSIVDPSLIGFRSVPIGRTADQPPPEEPMDRLPETPEASTE